MGEKKKTIIRKKKERKKPDEKRDLDSRCMGLRSLQGKIFGGKMRPGWGISFIVNGV